MKMDLCTETMSEILLKSKFLALFSLQKSRLSFKNS